MKTIKVNNTTLAYKEIGTGDKYLISTQNFFLTDCHMELLGKPPYNYHVFLVYMRGYGESEHIYDTQPNDYVTIWGEDIIAFAKAMSIDSFYYTGVSHGNWAGWYIAFNRPELLRGFVCCDGIAQYRSPSIQSTVPPNGSLDLDKIVGNKEALSKMAWMEYWPTQNEERLARRMSNHKEHLEVLLNRKKEEFTIVNTNMSACKANSQEDFYEALGKINVPVMILNGMLDPLAKKEDALKVANAIRGASFLAYQHLGHGGPDECPQLIARDCDRFFSDCEGRVL